MYHKVFINNVELAFGHGQLEGFTPLPSLPENHDLETWIETLRTLPEGIRFLVADTDGDQWQNFMHRHVFVTAAGGLVTNKNQELLVIKRLGFWDLPKGKMDAGETPAQCAIREVEEECGLHDLELGEELESTYHTYTHKGQNVLKRTHWFKMHYSGNDNPVPQTEEDITTVVFAPKSKVAEMVKESYPSLKPIFNTYLFGHE